MMIAVLFHQTYVKLGWYIYLTDLLYVDMSFTDMVWLYHGRDKDMEK